MSKAKLYQWILAIALLVITLGLFAWVLVRGAGGNEALFLIIGHLAAWAEMVVIFYFRKKPPKED